MIAASSLHEELNALFAGRQDLVDDPYPLYHRLLVPYGEVKLTDRYVESLVNMVFDGLEPR